MPPVVLREGTALVADANFVDDWSGFAPLEEALSVGDLECASLLKGVLRHRFT